MDTTNQEQIITINNKYDNFQEVLSFRNLFKAYKLCKRNVGWKSSTQTYKINAIYNIAKTHDKLSRCIYKSAGFHEFTIIERGKTRRIQSVHIRERVVQRALCDFSLVPMLSKSFIHDNGACLPGKGIDFAIRRLKCHLQRYYRRYGADGYVLLFDFSSYFSRINHDRLKGILEKLYSDWRLLHLFYQLIDDFGDRGLGLGSQISQICALAYPNKLDHYIKEQLHIKYYGRYMDDGYLIHHSKEYLQHCLTVIEKICTDMDIVINVRKTHLQRLSCGMVFLKKKLSITPTGKILCRPTRPTIVRMRRKLKYFSEQYKQGNMEMDDIKTSYMSWRGQMKALNARRTVYNMDALYNSLFSKEMRNEIS